jgi:hypothetical protein
VFWEPPWIELPVDFGFLAIQPRGNFVLQSDPLRIEANTAGKRVAMTEASRWRGLLDDEDLAAAIQYHSRRFRVVRKPVWARARQYCR